MDFAYRGETYFIVPLYKQLHRFGNLGNEKNLLTLARSIIRRRDFRANLPARDKIAGLTVSDGEILDRVREPTYTGVLYAMFQLLAEKRGKTRLIYKNPADIVHLPLIAKVLPTARFVHIVRDGRDVAMSLLKFRWGPATLYTGARYWRRQVAKGRSDGASLGDRYFECRLEDLIADTERTSTRLATFVNRDRNSDQTDDLVRFINEQKSIDKINVWKRSMDKKQRYLCEAAAGDMLRAYGYSTEFNDEIRMQPFKALYYETIDFPLRVKNRLLRPFK